MKFADDWRRSWRWVSVQAFGVIMAGHLALSILPPEERAAIERDYGRRISVATWVMAFLGFFGRITQQNGEPLSLPPPPSRETR